MLYTLTKVVMLDCSVFYFISYYTDVLFRNVIYFHPTLKIIEPYYPIGRNKLQNIDYLLQTFVSAMSFINLFTYLYHCGIMDICFIFWKNHWYISIWVSVLTIEALQLFPVSISRVFKWAFEYFYFLVL